MGASSASWVGPASGRNDDGRQKPAIVKNGHQRDDRAMTATHHRVATVVVDGMAALEPSVASEFFDRGDDEFGVPWYRHTFCTERPGRVKIRGGFDLHIDRGLDALSRADTIVIPGWSPVRQGVAVSTELAEALRKAHDRGARLVSFCTGAFALAGAGLLDGRVATTHWEVAGDLARMFPNVKVDPSVLYVDDGDILTSAGSAASIDLALYLVRSDFGADVANRLARDLVVPPHRDGGQAQYIDAPMPICPDTDPLAETLDWVLGHLDEAISVEQLARHATMSTRTFIRRFRAATGTTPHKWITSQRVAAAQALLETTDLSIERIADQCGFGTAASLRNHFHRQVHCSPQAYRHTFATRTPVAFP
jgi:AraC family transcriptional activator FtrA